MQYNTQRVSVINLNFALSRSLSLNLAGCWRWRGVAGPQRHTGALVARVELRGVVGASAQIEYNGRASARAHSILLLSAQIEWEYYAGSERAR